MKGSFLTRQWLVSFLVGTIASALFSPSYGQISPGPLSKPHEALDGQLSCFKCHDKSEEKRQQLCLACHQEISWLAANNRGLHGQVDRSSCVDCHVEHTGLDDSLVRFEEGSPDRFDHARAGWRLTGKHASVKCVDCHKVEFRKSAAARLSQRKYPVNSYIGLLTECVACHDDVHRGTQGRDCQTCHLTTEWRHTPGFNHANSAYPLTGGHVNVACEKCHRQTTISQAASKSPRRVFKPLAHAECSDCHRDVHQGRAGSVCTSCHVTESFRRLRPVTFDHARTGYPLEGKHLQVACEKCHTQNSLDGLAGKAPREVAAARRIPHERCGDCHADAHGGQLANRQDNGDCATCHRVQGWKPSTFTAKEHAALEFPLEGRHAAAQCIACHAPQSKGPAHSLPAETLGSARVALALGQPTCAACHSDPHGGRFAPGGARAQDQGCRGCHGFDVFRPSILLANDHANLGFSLEGAHVTVACDLCHKEIRPKDSKPESSAGQASVHDATNPLLFPAEKTCESCHESKSPHGDQFANRRDNGACQSCHDEQAFRPAGRFNHDRDTRFPLLRSHGDVACRTCHVGLPDPSGRLVVTYSPTTFDCKECHRLTAPTLPVRATRFSTVGAETPRKKKRQRR